MNHFTLIRIFILLCVLLGTSLPSWAQSSLKDLSVQYNNLRLDKGYSILYDNLNEAAKLNTFKIEFYNNSEYVDETEIEIFPLNGTIVTYELTSPIVRFNNAKLRIISLHSGDITNFPSSAASIIALNEPTDVGTEEEITPAEPVNKPPLAKDILFEFEATTDTLIRSISDKFSDPDGDLVAVVETSNKDSSLAYLLSSDGELTLTAPSITGVYTFPYEIIDSQGASASAEITAAVIFPEAMKSDLARHKQSLEQLQSEINHKKTELLDLPTVSEALISRREVLLSDNRALAEQASDLDLLTAKNDIAKLTEELEASKDTISIDTVLEQLANLESQSGALHNAIQSLDMQSLENGLDVNAFQAELLSVDGNLGEISRQKDAIDIPAVLTSAQIESWENRYQILQQQIPPPTNWVIVALIGLALGALLFWGLNTKLKSTPKLEPKNLEPNNKERHNKENEQKAPISFPVFVVNSTERGFTKTIKNYPQDMNNYNPDTGELEIPRPKGLIIPENPSFLIYKDPPALTDGPQSDPSPQGDSNPQSSTVPAWKTAYNATGRIGLAQEGIPEGDDESYGTCILVGPKHIMTNRHVFDRYAHLIRDEQENTGIEFYGEIESDSSEFYKISPAKPVIFEERDAVILTLEKHVDTDHRAPVEFSRAAPQSYAEDDVVVIGYPQEPFNFDDLDHRQMQVYGEIEIFGVKRYSVGQIFSHSLDVDGDYIAETVTSGKYSKSSLQPALTHLASTLPGNSGSPIVSKRTGHVIGLHFGDGAFETEPANVGHSGQILAEFVMSVTTDAFTS